MGTLPRHRLAHPATLCRPLSLPLTLNSSSSHFMALSPFSAIPSPLSAPPSSFTTFLLPFLYTLDRQTSFSERLLGRPRTPQI